VMHAFDMNNNADPPYTQVDAIDGMIMITQYDIPWREDLFQGWHYYDQSQSFEFRNKGYQVVVPHQKEAWCLHDSGVVILQDYDKNRRIFRREYLHIEKDVQEEFYGDEINDPQKGKWFEEIKNRLQGLFAKGGGLPAMSDFFRNIDGEALKDTELRVMKNVFEIYDLETSDTEKDYVIFAESYSDWPRLYAFYTEVKFLVRRIEQGYTGEEYVGELTAMYREKRISLWALSVIIKRTVFDWEKTLAFFSGKSEIPQSSFK